MLNCSKYSYYYTKDSKLFYKLINRLVNLIPNCFERTVPTKGTISSNLREEHSI